jgi:hypothetical protein
MFEVNESNIHGKGLFATENISKKFMLGLTHENGQPIGVLGSYHNHSDNPNTKSLLINNKRYLISSKPINKGDEITVDYTKQPELEQPENFNDDMSTPKYQYGTNGMFPYFNNKGMMEAPNTPYFSTANLFNPLVYSDPISTQNTSSINPTFLNNKGRGETGNFGGLNNLFNLQRQNNIQNVEEINLSDSANNAPSPFRPVAPPFVSDIEGSPMYSDNLEKLAGTPAYESAKESNNLNAIDPTTGQLINTSNTNNKFTTNNTNSTNGQFKGTGLSDFLHSPQALVDIDMNSALFTAGQSFAFDTSNFMDENTASGLQARRGNTMRGIGAVGKSLLNMGRLVGAGMGYQNKLQGVMSNASNEYRNALVGSYRFENGGEIKSDFDNTLWDNKKQSLTDLGKQIKKKIENGEPITILSAREDTPENKQFIALKLGIGIDKIKLGLTPDGKSMNLKEGDTFLDDNDANINATKFKRGVKVQKVYENGGLFQYLKNGGKIEDFPIEKILTGEYAIGLPEKKEEKGNAEVERDEYLQHPNGDVQKVVGETHENGGVKMQLDNGTRVISDNLEIGGDFAQFLRKEFDIDVLAKDTFANTLDKYTRKIGLKKLNEEQEQLFRKLKAQEDTEDEATLKLNSLFLGEKIKEIEDKKLPLESQRKDFFDIVYDKQETHKDKEKVLEKFEDGGSYKTKEYRDLLKKYNLTDKQANSLIENYSNGNTAFDLPMFQDGGMPEQGVNSQEQIVGMVMQMLQSGMSPEEVVGNLVNQGIPEEVVTGIVQGLMQQMQQPQEGQMQGQQNEGGQPMFQNGTDGQNPQYPPTLPYLPNYTYGMQGVNNALNSWNFLPNYSYKDLGNEKARLFQFAQEYGITPPEGFDKFNQEQLDAFAGQLQTSVIEKNHGLAKHYGTMVAPTKQGLETLVEKGIPKNLLPKGVLDKDGNVKIGTKEGDVSDKEIQNINNWIQTNLSPEDQSNYANKNFNDNKWYFRYPSKNEVYFKDKSEYDNYVKSIDGKGVGNGLYYSNKEGKYIKPVLLQPKEFKSEKEKQDWVEANKNNPDKLHNQFYAENPDDNTYYYPYAPGEKPASTPDNKTPTPNPLDNINAFNIRNRNKIGAMPYLPDQSQVPPDALIPHVKLERQYERLDPVELTPEDNLKEIFRGVDFATSQLNDLPDSQRRAALANLTANSQDNINKVITTINTQNAANRQSTEQFNISQSNAEEDNRVGDTLNFEARQLTALAKTQADMNNYLDFNRRVRLGNYNFAHNQQLISDLYENYNVDPFGQIQFDAANTQPLTVPGGGTLTEAQLNSLSPEEKRKYVEYQMRNKQTSVNNWKTKNQ